MRWAAPASRRHSTGTFGSEHPTAPGHSSSSPGSARTKSPSPATTTTGASPAILEELIFQPIAEGPDRRQALEAGDIDGYDLVAPADVAALESAGFQILERPAFNVGYIGFQQNRRADQQPADPTGDRARDQPRAHHHDELPGGRRGRDAVPAAGAVRLNEDVTTYDYDPDRAKQLIAESGVTNLDARRSCTRPTSVAPVHARTRSANFELIKSDLEAVGFTSRRARRSGIPTTSTPTPARRAAACSCSAGPATSAIRTTSSGRSSRPSTRSSAASRTRRSSTSSTRPRPRPTRTRASRRSTRRPTG